MTGPRIIFVDLESLPNLRQGLIKWTRLGDWPGRTMKLSSIICFGYKELGENKTHCVNAWDFPKWKKDVNNDYEVVNKAYKILKDADCIVTHNGKKFDWKLLQTRLLANGLPALPRIVHIDTLQVVRQNLYMFSNALGELGKELLNDDKMENGGWQLWVDVWDRKKSAQDIMTQYCKKDVELLEKLFLKLRPFIKNIPNYGIYKNDELGKYCPTCGGVDLKKRGTRIQRHSFIQSYQCKTCGSYSSKTIDRIKVDLKP